MGTFDDIPYSSANLRIAHRMVVSRSRQTPPTSDCTPLATLPRGKLADERQAPRSMLPS